MSAVIQNEYTGNNSTTTYSFTFPYLKTSDIKASLDGVATTAFTLPNATTLQFNTAPGSGVKIKIFRETSVDDLTATFYAGSAIKSEDLNDNFTQNLYKTQEVGARSLNTLGGTMTGNLTLDTQADIVFEGATADAHETTIKVVDPTADRTITFPNVTGTVVTTGDTGTVATGMIAADAVNGTKIADDSINSEHYVDGSIDTQHIANAQVTTDKIADSNVTTGKLAADAVTAAKLADNAVVTANIVDANVTTAKIAADAVNGTKIADNSIDSEHYVDGSIDNAHLADNSVTQAKMADDSVGTAELVDGSVDAARLADNSVTLAKMTNNSVGTSELVNDSVTNAKIADDQIDSEHYVDQSIDTQHISDNAITNAKMADNSVNSNELVDGSIDTVHIGSVQVTDAKLASNSVTTDKITDANVTTAKIANDAITIGKLGCEQTTISDSDSHIPTSGAVVDYVAAQLAPLGGFEAIANEQSFPNTQPASGVVISIADAGGLQVSSSGTASGQTVGGTTVNITGIASNFNGTTVAAGVRFLVASTGSGQNYTYHKATLKEDDLINLSGDINDFSERYRVGSSNPTSSLDNGDLFFNTSTGKLLVYNGTNSAWEEAQSIGNFFISTLSPAFNGSAIDFTLSNAPTNVQQVLLSINGVIQKPNAGTSRPSEGFSLNGSTIQLPTGSAPATGSDYFAVVMGSTVNIGTPSNNTVSTAILQDDSVTQAKIAAGAVDSTELAAGSVINSKIDAGAVTTASLGTNAVTNAKVASNAAIAGTKISPDFGSQNIATTGNVDADGVVRGNSSNSGKWVRMYGSAGTGRWDIYGHGANLRISDNDSAGSFVVDRNTDLNGGLDVTGNITVSGTVDGVDIAALNTTVGNISTEVVNDTSPQLGGNLDVNTRNIEFGDSSAATQDRLTFGAGDDLHMYHDGSDSFIKNSTGHLRIYGSGTDDKHIYLQPDDGDNGVIVVNNGGVKLYHNSVEKFETTSSGATVTGTCTATAFAGDGSALTGITSFVSGMIIMYNSATAPSGWYLCDGNNGTPDLRDRFIVGAGNNYSQGATGGATTDSISLSVSGNTSSSISHAYNFKAPYNNNGATASLNPHSHTFSGSGSATVDTVPPYYALTFIMKA